MPRLTVNSVAITSHSRQRHVPAVNAQLFCFLDVLGFSNLLRDMSLEIVYSTYKVLIESAGHQEHNGLVFSEGAGHPYFAMESLESSYFSDTLVFWCRYGPRHLQSLAFSMMEVLCMSVEIELPLRGAISVGEAILDKGKGHFVGKPIVSAADAEKVQRWIGITLSKEFRDPPFNQGFSAAFFRPYERHLKAGGLAAVTPLVLGYPGHWGSTRRASLNCSIARLDRDPVFSEYYRNSHAFVQHSNKNPAWWESHPEYQP